MGWAESGQAWGERAADWAYLIGPNARRANDVLFDRPFHTEGLGVRIVSEFGWILGRVPG